MYGLKFVWKFLVIFYYGVLLLKWICGWILGIDVKYMVFIISSYMFWNVNCSEELSEMFNKIYMVS